MNDKYSTLPRSLGLGKTPSVSLSEIPDMIAKYEQELETKKQQELALATLVPPELAEAEEAKAEAAEAKPSDDVDEIEIEIDEKQPHFELPSTTGKGKGKKGKKEKAKASAKSRAFPKAKPGILKPSTFGPALTRATMSTSDTKGSSLSDLASVAGSLGSMRKKTKDRDLFAKADYILNTYTVPQVLEGGMGKTVWQAQQTTEALERSHKALEQVILLRQHVNFLQLAQEPRLCCASL